MNCELVRELLPLCVNGRIGPAQRGPVAAHLAGCSACVQELAELSDLAAAVRASAAAAPTEFRPSAAPAAPAPGLDALLAQLAQCWPVFGIARFCPELRVLGYSVPLLRAA